MARAGRGGGAGRSWADLATTKTSSAPSTLPEITELEEKLQRTRLMCEAGLQFGAGEWGGLVQGTGYYYPGQQAGLLLDTGPAQQEVPSTPSPAGSDSSWSGQQSQPGLAGLAHYWPHPGLAAGSGQDTQSVYSYDSAYSSESVGWAGEGGAGWGGQPSP